MGSLLRIPLALVMLACLSLPSHSRGESLLADKTPTLDSIARNCMACHGERGVGVSDAMPTLAGLDRHHFITLLQDYRDGKTPATIMNRLMQGFSDDDISRLADYFQELASR